MKNSTERIPMVLGSVGAFVAVAIAVWFALSSSGKEPLGITDMNSRQFVSYTYNFSAEVPKSYVVSEQYTFDITPQLKSIGVAFTVPASYADGTNLSPDTRITVENVPILSSCSPQSYVNPVMSTSTVTENGVTYNVARSSEAAAGNVYEHIVYMAERPGPCYAVRYFIHTTNIANYPEGTVQEYDREKLLAEFDAIRHSLRFDVL